MGAKELRQGAKSVVCGCFCGKKAILGKTPSSGRFACNFVKRERLDICMEIYFRKLGRFWVTFVQQTPLSKNAFNNFLVVTFLVGFASPIICNRLASVAGPRGSAGFSSGHKRNRYKKVAAPALHYPAALPLTTLGRGAQQSSCALPHRQQCPGQSRLGRCSH